MDKKNININKLEKFLETAKGKINEGIEDIGENNFNKLEGFLSEIKKEKGNLENISLQKDKNIDKEKVIDMGEINGFEDCEFEVVYKKDLLKEMSEISNENPPFDINFEGNSDK